LLHRVVIFKDPFAGAPAAYRIGYPKASGFFLKSDDTSLYVVTARHVFSPPRGRRTSDVMIVPDPHLRIRPITWHFPPGPTAGLTDSMADISVLPLGKLYKKSRSSYDRIPCWFSISDIVTEDEMEQLAIGDSVFYIGAYPDSIDSRKNWYTFPHGVIKAISSEPMYMRDARRGGLVGSAQIFLSIWSKGGISGSPVLRRTQSGRYQLIGVISGKVNQRESPYDGLIYFTPAYKLLHLVK